MANEQRINTLNADTIRVGILFNPLSGQVRKREKDIRQTLTEISPVIIQEASNTSGFKTSISNLLQASIDMLVIVGGDGTIHAALDFLFAKQPPAEWPVLAIIAGGTTNMTSIDLGIRGKPEHALKQLRNFLLQPQLLAQFLITRPALCIGQSSNNKIYGLFFAVGLVARGVKFSRSNVKQLGVTGGAFTLFIMLRSLLGMLFGQHQREWAPVKITIVESDGKARDGTYLFALVSALDCLLLGIKPYWGKEHAPLHVTMVDQQHKYLWRSLWPLLLGRGHKLKKQNGYHSRNVNVIEMHIDDEYIVDGELYQATRQNGPLRIFATDPITFLVI